IIPCDTLLLSVGLIPENELSRKAGVAIDPVTAGPFVDDHFQTSLPGFYSAGNVVHVYDLVDWVSQAGLIAGKAAALDGLRGHAEADRVIPVTNAENVRYVVPQTIHPDHLAEHEIRIQFRVRTPMEFPVWLEARAGEKLLTRKPEPYARPGEMLTIVLRQNLYDEVQHADSISVAVVRRA
ncbi:MAG TPA: pyridine nucleotide-disulfide oxidoreductase, partial [Anaerolineaceae bacterium]|nr:pyridine nucleotide-disulfide oxidoreductase [Anaerolineaceae bacterium]